MNGKFKFENLVIWQKAMDYVNDLSVIKAVPKG